MPCPCSVHSPVPTMVCRPKEAVVELGSLCCAAFLITVLLSFSNLLECALPVWESSSQVRLSLEILVSIPQVLCAGVQVLRFIFSLLVLHFVLFLKMQRQDPNFLPWHKDRPPNARGMKFQVEAYSSIISHGFASHTHLGVGCRVAVCRSLL